MIRIFLLFSLFLTVSLPAIAQESEANFALFMPLVQEGQEKENQDSDDSDAKLDPDKEEVLEQVTEDSEDALYEKRLALSREMHKIWPVRPKIENALDNIAAQIDPQNRVRFKAAMRKAINYNSVEQASIEAMAEIFTIGELNAMIAFYGSKEGRSVSFKTDDYERALQPVFTKMLDKALLDTKLGQ